MKGTILYGPRDIRFEEREEPQIIEPTDANAGRLLQPWRLEGLSFRRP